jgi:NifU-like protein involved in Fe-S cluster formation
MPCNNVIEQIRITLNDQDRLCDYQFVKQTCGQGVGARSLLIDFLLGLSVDELLAVDGERLLQVCRPQDEIGRFLHLKHLFAIQGALHVYTGAWAGGRASPCTVAEIGYDQGQVVIDADIDVDLVTDKIKACIGCTGCGKK